MLNRLLFVDLQLDEEARGHGWVVVFDFNGAGFANCDMEMAKFLINTLTKYFPTGLAFALAVDFPWILKTFWNVVKNLIPANRRSLLRFTSSGEVTDFIDAESLPAYIGGSCTRPCEGWALAPENCPSAVEFGLRELNIPKEKAEKLFEVFDKIIEEDDHLVATAAGSEAMLVKA